MISKERLNFIAAIIGVLFLFFAMNPFIMWIIWPVLINVPLFVFVLIVTLILGKAKLLTITYNRLFFAFFIFFFMIHLGTPLLGNAGWDVGKIMSFSGLICLLFFTDESLFKTFNYFRKLFIFLSWFALVIFLITFVGIELPYYKIPAFTLVMQNSFGGEAFYKLYGLVVSSTNTVYSFGPLSISRICGPVQEPGHFAIYIGVLLFFEKIIYSKISNIFVIVGLLTFSPNFFLFLSLIFIYDFLRGNNRGKLIGYVCLGILIFLVALFSSDTFADQILFLLVGRNFDTTGFNIDSILDKRAGKVALTFYNHYASTYEVWYGKGVEEMSKYGILSDYRGMIFKYGIIGLLLSLCSSFIILFFSNNKLNKVLVFFIIVAIYLQRSWMFESTFIYLFLISGFSCLKFYSDKNYSNEL